MRIRMKKNRRREDRIVLNLASMIDVTFLLLIYFMVTMIFAPVEDRLQPRIQTKQDSASGQSSDFQPQIIEVLMSEGTPVYRMGTREFRNTEALRQMLEPLPKTAGVFVNVFDEAPVGFAVGALQAAHDAGFEQVTYVPSS